jgi:parallel beta-helix repeat protein
MGSSGSINNTIKNNTIISNKPYGILMLDVYNNSITDNTIKLNPTGIFIHNDSYGYGISNYNAIYNNYFNNSVNAVDTGNNFWNTTKTLGTNIIGGPYIGGNFWSDYNGVDTSNPSDGIGDTLVPYSSNGNIANGGDYLPLVSVCGDGIWEYGEWCGRDCYIATGSTDMNHDCVVDTLDAILITKHFGSINYSSGDLNGDGVVDMHDIVIFSQHYGDFITSCTDAGQYFIDKKGSLSISFSNDTSNIINSTNVSVNSTLNAYIIASDVQNLTSLEFGLLSSPNLIFSGFSVSPGLTLSGGIESRIEIIGDGSQLVSGSAVIGWATYNVTGTGNGNISIIKNSHFGELEWSKNPEELYRANFANIFNATITSSVPINITILSPINSGNYSATSIPLTYTVSEPASWCGYSLDGTANKTIPSCTNITLSGLSYTTHNVIVYANDTSGNMGASGKVYFTVTSGGGRGCGRSCLMT